MKFAIGQSAARVEDRSLLVGAGSYSDDVAPGQGLRIAFLRAPHAHARMGTPNVSAARKLAGICTLLQPKPTLMLTMLKTLSANFAHL